MKTWIKENPGEQIICYSQWTSMIDCELSGDLSAHTSLWHLAPIVVIELLERENIKALRFDGRMTRRAREGALEKFREQGGPPILMISLKCGGVGLNVSLFVATGNALLTSFDQLVNANRCINLDLAWNAATENQVCLSLPWLTMARHWQSGTFIGYWSCISVWSTKRCICQAYSRSQLDRREDSSFTACETTSCWCCVRRGWSCQTEENDRAGC